MKDIAGELEKLEILASGIREEVARVKQYRAGPLNVWMASQWADAIDKAVAALAAPHSGAAGKADEKD